MPVRAVVFDLGHTIWDIPQGERPWTEAITRMHERLAREQDLKVVPSTASLGRALGLATTDWESRYADGQALSQPPSSHFIEEALRSLDINASNAVVDELTDMLFGSELAVRTVEPDTRAALQELHAQGRKLGCVTNTLLLEKAILDLLNDLEVRAYFSSVVVSSEVGYRKPHPSLFQRALDELDVAAAHSIFVGDSLQNDIAGAKALGMPAVLTRQYRQESVQAANPAPDAVITRLSELPAVLDGLDSRQPD